MSHENPTYEGEKKFAAMESQDPISFGSGKSKKREPILIIVIVVLVVLALAFIILYAKERNDASSDSASTGGTGKQGLCVSHYVLVV